VPNDLSAKLDFPADLDPVFAPMARGDLPYIAQIEVRSFPTPWSMETYRQELLNHNGSYWVVRPGTHARNPSAPPILAYGGMWLLGEEAHVTAIATHPEWRRRHLGEWLLLNMLAEARRHGIHDVTLEVRMHNHGATALYRKLGFEIVGLRRGYYHDTGEDARLLTLFGLNDRQVWNKLEARLAAINGAMPGSRPSAGQPR
jgi:ribosomal-protein-alanine N-acetyltransferase